MTAFDHWTAMHAWWIAVRTQNESISKPWAARKTESGEVSGTAATEKQPKAPTPPPAEPSVLDLAQQRMNDDKARPRPATPEEVDNGCELGEAYGPMPPDEGGAVTDADIETMRKAYAALPPPASQWATDIMRQRNNGHPWNKLSETKTVRRYELYRGVLTLAQWGGGAETTNDAVRAIVHAVTPAISQFETVPPGLLLGTLNYGQATQFAQTAYDLATERYTLVYDDNGTCRLQAVT